MISGHKIWSYMYMYKAMFRCENNINLKIKVDSTPKYNILVKITQINQQQRIVF